MKYEVAWCSRPPVTVEAGSEIDALRRAAPKFADNTGWNTHSSIPEHRADKDASLNNGKLWDKTLGHAKNWRWYVWGGFNWAVRPLLKAFDVSYSGSGKVATVEAEDEPSALAIYANSDHYIRNLQLEKFGKYTPGDFAARPAKEGWNTFFDGTWWWEARESGKAVTPLKAKSYLPRTQKAKGIVALGDRTLSHIVLPIEEAKPEQLVGRFARPCPMRPRHGFVDSRYIADQSEAERILAETKAADPEAEILLMERLAATHSGIWTPGMLTVGVGSDGATQGKTALQMPTLGTAYPWSSDSYSARCTHEELCGKAAVRSAPYIELLWPEPGLKPIPVQLRDGPKLPQTVNFIPAEVTVRRILTAHGDLLDWEATMKAAREGDVVYHPHGSLASHYAVHAVLNNVPVLIDRKPKVGEVLKAESVKREANIFQLRAGFFYAQYWDITMQTAARVMLAATHNIAVWTGRCDFLLGLGLGCAFRLAVVAGLGEYRHHRRDVPKGGKKYPRETVYACYWKRSLQGITQERVQLALKSFCDPGVSAWQGGGYGGMKWYEFLKWAPVIHNQLLSGMASEVLESLNSVTNACHNGGWGFDKFIGKSEFDAASENPAWVLIQVAPYLYDAAEECSQKNMVDRMMKRGIIDIPPAPEKPKRIEKTTTSIEKKLPLHQVADFVPGSEKLYVVQIKKGEEWKNTAWTNWKAEEKTDTPPDTEFAIPVPFSAAEAALKQAQGENPSQTYRLQCVYTPNSEYAEDAERPVWYVAVKLPPFYDWKPSVCTHPEEMAGGHLVTLQQAKDAMAAAYKGTAKGTAKRMLVMHAGDALPNGKPGVPLPDAGGPLPDDGSLWVVEASDPSAPGVWWTTAWTGWKGPKVQPASLEQAEVALAEAIASVNVGLKVGLKFRLKKVEDKGHEVAPLLVEETIPF